MRDRVRYQAFLIAGLSINIFGLMWLRPPWWGVALLVTAEFVAGLVFIYTLGPRLFPSVIADDPVFRATRTGAPRRRLVAFAGRATLWALAMSVVAVGPPAVISVVVARSLQSLDSPPPWGVILTIVTGIWMLDAAALIALRGPLRRWAGAHQPRFPA